jgi:hypothetical protein
VATLGPSPGVGCDGVWGVTSNLDAVAWAGCVVEQHKAMTSCCECSSASAALVRCCGFKSPGCHDADMLCIGFALLLGGVVPL